MYNEAVENPQGFFEPAPGRKVDKPARPATPMWKVANEVTNERVRQDKKWGEQNHPDRMPEDVVIAAAQLSTEPLPDNTRFLGMLANVRRINDALNAQGKASWDYILLEEVLEALTAETEEERRAELVQVTAVGMAWIEALDRRTGGPSTEFAEGF